MGRKKPCRKLEIAWGHLRSREVRCPSTDLYRSWGNPVFNHIRAYYFNQFLPLDESIDVKTQDKCLGLNHSLITDFSNHSKTWESYSFSIFSVFNPSAVELTSRVFFGSKDWSPELVASWLNKVASTTETFKTGVTITTGTAVNQTKSFTRFLPNNCWYR